MHRILDEGHESDGSMWQGNRRTLGQSLQGGQGLTTVALLDTNVDVILLRSDVLGGTEVTLVCEGVYEPVCIDTE